MKYEISKAYIVEHGEDYGYQAYLLIFDLPNTMEEVEQYENILRQFKDGEPVKLTIEQDE